MEYRVSRWAKVEVNQKSRNADLDDTRQHHCYHRGSTLKIGDREITPYIDMPNTTIYAIRVYKGGPYTAIMHHAYYQHYGCHRIHLAQDNDLGQAVYAYVDVATALI